MAFGERPRPSLGERLDGHKTYLSAVGFALLGAYKLRSGRWEDAIELGLVAMATASLRSAIAGKEASARGEYLEDHD